MPKPSIFTATGYMVAALVIAANAAALTAGATSWEMDHNDAVGLALLGAGALAVVYVASGVAQALLSALWRFVRRPRGGLPHMVPGWVIAAGAALILAAAIGATLFKHQAGGLEEALNTLSFFTFATLVLGAVVLAIATGIVWATQDPPRMVEIEVRERHE